MAISWASLKKTSDVSKIDKQISEIESEITALEVNRSEIEEQLSEQWGTDTAQLESDYNRIDAKIAGAKKAISKLEGLRADALQRSTVNDYKSALKSFESALKKRNKLSSERDKVKESLESIKQELQATGSDIGEFEHQLQRIMKQAIELGLSADEEQELQAERLKIVEQAS